MDNKISKIIREHFDANIISITKITEGYSHFMYDVEIDKEPHSVIVRFSNNTDKKFSIKKEKYIMDLLLKNKISIVPKVFGYKF